MKQSGKNYKRIVIKIGSNLLFKRSGHSGINLDFNVIDKIIRQVIQLVEGGKEVVIVSSGAIALGMSLLKSVSRPRELSRLQAMAAIGQHELMDMYRQTFKKGKLNCAQVLLTNDDCDNRKRYLNAKNTLLTLLQLNCIPIVNENDTVSTDEIRFGDNDRLSALVSGLINADLLIMLSDVDGLLDKEKKLVRLVEKITPQIKEFACPTDKNICVGGMVTKIEAAKIAIDSGIPCVIANGRNKNIIFNIIRDPVSGGQWTVFVPKTGYLDSKSHWIAFGTKPKGKIVVDEGAEKAILANKSLLSVGIVSVEGNFNPKDIVLITNKKGSWIAKGSTTASSVKIQEVKGKRYNREIIHCDNIVML